MEFGGFVYNSGNMTLVKVLGMDNGGLTSENRYMPFGEVRTISGHTEITETDFGYTGQRNYSYIKLIDYGARWYSQSLGRFIQPDTIIPDLNNSQSFNRYAYVENSPITFIDPSGHEKVIIIYGVDEGTNSFQAAAETKKQELLEMGYDESDILMVDEGTEGAFLMPYQRVKLGKLNKSTSSHMDGILIEKAQITEGCN